MTLSPNPKPGYLRPKDAATYLSVTLSTIYRLISSKKLKSRKEPGGAMVVKAADVDSLIERNCQAPVEHPTSTMQTPSTRSPYLRSAEAAEYARVTRSTIYAWMKQKKLKSYLVGGVRLFKASDLDALIESSISE